MKVGIWLLALALCIGFTGTAHAAKEKKGKALRGKITKVEDGKITVKHGSDEVTVSTDDKTSVTLDGKDAKVADLKEGLFVAVTPAEGTATSITATTKRPEHKKKTDSGTDSKTNESK